MPAWDGRRSSSRSGGGGRRGASAKGARAANAHVAAAGVSPPTADEHDAEGDHNVRVFVRARPLLSHEAGDGDCMRALRILDDGRSVYIKDRFVDEKILSFNKVFGPESGQDDVFQDVGLPACGAALCGLNGSVITYGQTGTGKTYTAFNTEPGSEGLMVRCVQHVFQTIEDDPKHNYTVYVQYLQLYKEQISDLLDEQGTVEIREDSDKGVYIKGATTIPVRSPTHVLSLFDTGNKSRVVRLTTMNAQSSRSHALFLLTVKRTPAGAAEGHGESVGRLTLVDLAGSERIKRTRADSLRRQEAQSINMSLSCLGTVIHALTDPKSTHVPYRSCKLTRILRNCLGEYGNASVVVTISSALADVSETLGSLYFGTRALCVRQTYAIPQNIAMGTKSDDANVKNLEYQVAFLEANNTQLREAAQEDETLIEELSHQIKRAVCQQDRIMGERCAATQEVDALRRKVRSYSEALRERDAAMEGVLEQELSKQRDDYGTRLREMHDVIRRQQVEMKALQHHTHTQHTSTTPHAAPPAPSDQAAFDVDERPLDRQHDCAVNAVYGNGDGDGEDDLMASMLSDTDYDTAARDEVGRCAGVPNATADAPMPQPPQHRPPRPPAKGVGPAGPGVVAAPVVSAPASAPSAAPAPQDAMISDAPCPHRQPCFRPTCVRMDAGVAAAATAAVPDAFPTGAGQCTSIPAAASPSPPASSASSSPASSAIEQQMVQQREEFTMRIEELTRVVDAQRQLIEQLPEGIIQRMRETQPATPQRSPSARKLGGEAAIATAAAAAASAHHTLALPPRCPSMGSCVSTWTSASQASPPAMGVGSPLVDAAAAAAPLPPPTHAVSDGDADRDARARTATTSVASSSASGGCVQRAHDALAAAMPASPHGGVPAASTASPMSLPADTPQSVRTLIAKMHNDCAVWQQEVMRVREENARMQIEKREDRALLCSLIKERDALLKAGWAGEGAGGGGAPPVPPLAIPSRVVPTADASDTASVSTARTSLPPASRSSSASCASTVPAPARAAAPGVVGSTTPRTTVTPTSTRAWGIDNNNNNNNNNNIAADMRHTTDEGVGLLSAKDGGTSSVSFSDMAASMASATALAYPHSKPRPPSSLDDAGSIEDGYGYGSGYGYGDGHAHSRASSRAASEGSVFGPPTARAVLRAAPAETTTPVMATTTHPAGKDVTAKAVAAAPTAPPSATWEASIANASAVLAALAEASTDRTRGGGGVFRMNAAAAGKEGVGLAPPTAAPATAAEPATAAQAQTAASTAAPNGASGANTAGRVFRGASASPTPATTRAPSPSVADQVSARLRRAAAASGVPPRERSVSVGSSVDCESILGTFAVDPPFPDCTGARKGSDAMRGMDQLFSRLSRYGAPQYP